MASGKHYVGPLTLALASVARGRRGDAGLTQEKMAGLAGFKKRTYQNFEQGRYALDVNELTQLAAALDVTASELVTEAEAVVTSDESSGGGTDSPAPTRRGSNAGERPSRQHESSRVGAKPRKGTRPPRSR